MADNQHRKISGYRELSEDEIRAMNGLKELEKDCLEVIEHARDDLNGRHIALAKTHIETAFMYAVKAIAKPEPYYSV